VQVFLIRHPSTEVPSATCYGRTDVDLSSTARGELQNLAEKLRARLPHDAELYSSPLRRCRALAEQLHDAPIVDTRIGELDFGEWEMRPWDAIPRAELDAWAAAPLEYTIPGGESVARMCARVAEFLDERRAAGSERLALVTHAGVIKIALGIARGVPTQEWMAWRFEHGSLHAFEWQPRRLSGT
jgi:alpha-ribazole phosphatase